MLLLYYQDKEIEQNKGKIKMENQKLKSGYTVKEIKEAVQNEIDYLTETIKADDYEGDYDLKNSDVEALSRTLAFQDALNNEDNYVDYENGYLRNSECPKSKSKIELNNLFDNDGNFLSERI